MRGRGQHRPSKRGGVIGGGCARTLNHESPRRYVIDGRQIHEDGDFGRAVDEAMFGPMTDRSDRKAMDRRLDLDGFSDWLFEVWPREVDSVLVWAHHERCQDMSRTWGVPQPKPIFDVIVDLLHECEVPYVLE